MKKAEGKQDIGKHVMAQTTDHMDGAKGVLKEVVPHMGKVLWENGRHTWISLTKLVVMEQKHKHEKATENGNRGIN